MKRQAPKVTPGKTGETNYNHPAFGQITLVQSSYGGGGAILYGSNIPHHYVLTMRIHASEMVRNLSYDQHHSGKEYVEVVLSEAQWARLQSAVGSGEGVPCTIQHVNGEQTPQLDKPIDKHQQFKSELVETLEKALEAAREAEALVEASNLSGVKKKEIVGKLASITRNIGPNLGFVADQFAEHMDHTVDAAKIELASFAQRHGFGAPALPALTNDSPPPQPPQIRRRTK